MYNIDQWYAEVHNTFFIKKYFGDNLLEKEKIIIKEKNNIIFKNTKVKKFYQKYENEINSFKREKFYKIFEDTKLRVELVISTYDNSHKIIINGVKLKYIDYQKPEKNYCVEKLELLFNKNKFKQILDNTEIEYDEYLNSNIMDISIIVTINVLDRDELGIYFLNNNGCKKYIYTYVKEKNLWSFLIG